MVNEDGLFLYLFHPHRLIDGLQQAVLSCVILPEFIVDSETWKEGKESEIT